jgi:hypothetical protein
MQKWPWFWAAVGVGTDQGLATVTTMETVASQLLPNTDVLTSPVYCIG